MARAGQGASAEHTIPLGYFRWRVRLPGYRTREFAETGVLQPMIRFALYREAGSPADMELVPAGNTFGGRSVKVPEFWMDRFEVSNRRYQDFADAGGYRRPEFWREPFVKEGKTLTWEQAMSEFRDQDGTARSRRLGRGQVSRREGRLPGNGSQLVRGRRLRALCPEETADHTSSGSVRRAPSGCTPTPCW